MQGGANIQLRVSGQHDMGPLMGSTSHGYLLMIRVLYQPWCCMTELGTTWYCVTLATRTANSLQVFQLSNNNAV